MNVTDLPERADTIVVGAGTGGAAFAGMLAQNSYESVLVLDAGPDYGPYDSGRWPTDMLNAKAIPLSHDIGLTSTPDGLDLPRARIVGGCSAHNGCTASRSAALDYDEWASAGNPGWDARTVEPLLDWVHESFRVRRYRRDELTVAQDAFVEAGTRSGLPFADDLDDLAAGIGIGPMPVNIVNGVRWNAAFAFLDPVRDRPNLTIAGNTQVRRVIVEEEQAAGVEVTTANGQHRTIRSSRVVVAGGAYHSPAVLQRSGIGPADLLRKVGIDVVVDRPGVGEHLLDHACIQLDFHGRPGLLEELALQQWNPDEQTVGRARSTRCDDGPYDIHVFMVAGANSGHPDLPPVTLYGGAMRATSEGRVTITGPDADTEPVVDHRYGTDPRGHDRAVLTDALSLLRTMTREPALASVLGTEHEPNRDPLDNIVSYCHPAGTCKMGPASDPTAVVDATGAVHGVGGLYVADAAVMPAITRGNINLPTAMIGARIAATMLGLSPRQAVSNASVDTAAHPATSGTTR